MYGIFVHIDFIISRLTVVVVMVVFDGKTKLETILDNEGKFTPATDLVVVGKTELIRYICHLTSKLEGKERAIKELTSSHQESIKTLVDAHAKSIIDITTSVTTSLKHVESLKPAVDNELNTKIDELQASITSLQNVKKVSLPYAPDGVPKPQLDIDPYEELTKDFLDETDQQNIRTSLEGMDYKDINSQREVCYMGDYKYKYRGGSHDPAPIPEPIQHLIEKVIEKHPGYTVQSCLSTLSLIHI